MELSTLLDQAPRSGGNGGGGMMPGVKAEQPTLAPSPSATVVQSHQYPTRRSLSQHGQTERKSTPDGVMATNGHTLGAPATPASASRTTADLPPKHVTFELLFTDPSRKARLPMRVAIFSHDATESIVTTVKNFYGLYDGVRGVSFEDENGRTLIARYENFVNKMTVYVRAILNHAELPGGPSPGYTGSPIKGSPLSQERDTYKTLPHQQQQQPAQILTYGETYPVAAFTGSRKRSLSPDIAVMPRGRTQHVDGLQQDGSRSQSARKSRGSSPSRNPFDIPDDIANGYSSSSDTASRKAKGELASAEISLDNIVEGGRRKRAKFESSELPLFVPPQVPLAGSSNVSPAARAAGVNGYQTNSYTNGNTGAYRSGLQYQLQSPRSLSQHEPPAGYQAHTYSTPSMPQHSHQLRTRGSGSNTFPPSRASISGVNGILPTPDPTNASCISDEDVAIQLMRLGDASNISNGTGTRNSTSTVDDALSGAADVASSSNGMTGDSDLDAEGESESDLDGDDTQEPTLPQPRESSPIPLPGQVKKRHKHLDEILPSVDSTELSSDEADSQAKPNKRTKFGVGSDTTALNGLANSAVRAERQPINPFPAANPLPAPKKRASTTSRSVSGKVTKPRAPGRKRKCAAPTAPVSTVNGTSAAPISPASLPPGSRKPSNASASHPPGSSAASLNFQHPLAEDETDLSSKPRCQRCRKSKKGCDRQRPCQRCKDAGIGADGCVSEDETNGRKGRFGRHMGVVVKKGDGSVEGGAPVAVEAGEGKKRKR